MPDFDLRSSASFISSKEGGTPVSFNRSWMNMRSSFCFSVSIWSPLSDQESGRSSLKTILAPPVQNMNSVYVLFVFRKLNGHKMQWPPLWKAGNRVILVSVVLI